MRIACYSLALFLLTGWSLAQTAPRNGSPAGLDSVPSADKYAASAVSAPAQAAGLSTAATGGAVAANTYACEVTYNGAAGGETTASPASAAVTTTGRTSVLYCFANDAPAGASSFNVYWQTGGLGMFYRDARTIHVAFGVPAMLSVTPATSGSIPPGSNTATGVIAAAQSALAGTSGFYVVPNTLGVAAGNAGDPAPGQTVLDMRSGAILSRQTVGSPQKSMTGSVMNYGYSLDMVTPELAAGQQVNGIGVSMESGGAEYGTTLPLIPGTAAVFGRNYRFGTSRNATWAGNFAAWFANQNAIVAAQENDCYNASRADAESINGCTGLAILGNGPNASWAGMTIGGAPAGQGFVDGISIDGPSIHNIGISIGAGIPGSGIFNQSMLQQAAGAAATSTHNSWAAPLQFSNSVWDGGRAGFDYYQIFPVGGTGTNAWTSLIFRHSGNATYPTFQFQGGTGTAAAAVLLQQTVAATNTVPYIPAPSLTFASTSYVSGSSVGDKFSIQPSGSGNSASLNFTHNSGVTGPIAYAFDGPIHIPAITTTTCATNSSPASCAAAPGGAVAIRAGDASLTVNTTAVTAASQIQLTFDSSLGTTLGVTCSRTINQPTVSARTPGTGFTITMSSTVTANPACISYTITN